MECLIGRKIRNKEVTSLVVLEDCGNLETPSLIVASFSLIVYAVIASTFVETPIFEGGTTSVSLDSDSTFSLKTTNSTHLDLCGILIDYLPSVKGAVRAVAVKHFF